MTFPATISQAKLKPRPVWATMIPTRNPEFKQHNTLGQAKNAMTYSGWPHLRAAALYELNESAGEWVLRLVFEDLQVPRRDGQVQLQTMERTFDL